MASVHTWILLRGLAREKGHWGDFIEKFSARFPGDEVLAIDLPGTGEHLSQASPMTITGIFNHVRSEAISRAKNQSQFKLVALSLGGMVAMEWMRQKSDDLAGCILINTSAKELSPFYNRLRWQVWRDFARLVSVQAAREREKGIIEVIMNSPEAREAALPEWTKIAVERPISYKNFFNQLLAASRFDGLKTNTDVPTLILNSLGDRLVDPSCSTKLHERFNWPIRRHPWGGHDLPWDDANWVLDRIQEWN
ncbi:MAG: alpha/beta fold hydrolase [Bdellovibrionales bacterium]